MTEQHTIHIIILNDGRRLGYAEFGDPAGYPIFYFTGGTASGLFARTLHSAASQVGARIIAPDRPGIGLSDFQPGRTLGDWPNDVCELADSLGIERFAVASESGGSPYVALCALKIPNRLTSAGIISGTSPLDAPHVLEGMSQQNRFSVLMMQKAPAWLLRLIYWPTALTVRCDPEKLRSQLATLGKAMSEPDRVIYNTPEFQAAIWEAFCAAFRQGSRGPVLDLKLCSQSWGRWLQDIPIEVQLWHGKADQNTPIAMAHYLQQAIPKSQATFYPNEGHISVMHNHGREILQKLIADDHKDLKQ